MPIWVYAVARQYHSQMSKKLSKDICSYYMDQAARHLSARIGNFDKVAFIRYAETLK